MTTRAPLMEIAVEKRNPFFTFYWAQWGMGAHSLKNAAHVTEYALCDIDRGRQGSLSGCLMM